jgi:hypothetical protein
VGGGYRSARSSRVTELRKDDVVGSETIN